MQMAAKIVYYGPGLCGKTSNLSYIYAKTTPNSRGEMVSLETESDRTLFFDLLPIEVGTIGGFKTRLQLYTVPGQVFYNTTRKLVLKGVDGLVFVADSQRPMREANIESFTSLVENLEDLGLDMSELPLVLQYNKRDLKNILTVDELNHDLNPRANYPFHEASAINGNGVFETLKEITKLTLKKLRTRMASSQPGAAAPVAEPVRPAMPPQRPESISAAALARAAEEGVDSDQAAAPAPEQPQTPPPIAVPQPASPHPDTGSEVFATDGAAPDDAGPDGPMSGAEASARRFDEDSQPDPGAMSADIEEPMEIPSVEVQPPSTAAQEAVQDPQPAAPEPPPDDTELEEVEFDQSTAEPAVEPPPMKRVHVSNQLDILAELESLRSGSMSDSPSGSPRPSSAEIDIDSLISGAVGGSRELRKRLRQELNSDTFGRMRGLELVVRVRNAEGQTIHSLAPAVLEVDRAGDLSRLSLRVTVDLDNVG
jgi:signal recognition particle receptor subunit beta